MTLDLFKQSIRDFLPWLLKVNLYDEGEPLLNGEVFEIIRHLRRYNVGASVSSHFSIALPDAMLREILACGLDHLVVAIDGASQESYGCYRRRGSLDLVISNLRRLMEFKGKAAHSRLCIDLQFIAFEHNRHEQNTVARLAQELGASRFVVIQGSSPKGWEGVDFGGSPEQRRRRGCYQTWVAAHINSDGSLGTCDYGEDHGIPNIGRASDYRSAGLRNHPTLVELRRSFSGRGGPLHQVCRTCSLYRKA